MTPKHVTSGEARLRGLALGQHSSKETSQRWQAVGDTVFDLTGPGIEAQTFRADSDVFNNNANGSVHFYLQDTNSCFTFSLV